MVRAFVLLFLCLWRLVDVKAEVKSVSVMEGDSVTLNTDVTEIQKYLSIKWTFGSTRIAQIINSTQTSSTYDGPDKRFKDRLKLDRTGSLTITNTRTTDSGVYILSLTRGETKYKSFNVQVNVTTQTSSSPERTSSSNCVLSSCMVKFRPSTRMRMPIHFQQIRLVMKKLLMLIQRSTKEKHKSREFKRRRWCTQESP
ncbi:uncharacterized protein LOC125263456 isoform X2 [Megalobrama amblycephala]|uniref:uncharacterized protein LOC125263456 isoform X2 n=1 Tax=Megalobrama amblycephala TaxID=75352 RepID=UPI0020140C0A|nr:uncharacterized protein LOC125263456 isoform X2 [Megalobrama amblycephala]